MIAARMKRHVTVHRPITDGRLHDGNERERPTTDQLITRTPGTPSSRTVRYHLTTLAFPSPMPVLPPVTRMILLVSIFTT
jgi:hypothetical protein